MNFSTWYQALRTLSVKWKIFLLAAGISVLSVTAGFAYFAYQSYWLTVTTALAGLMNFTDAKQHGVIRFIDQNKKLAAQLADLAERTDTKTLRAQFNSVVTTDVFRPEDHPFKDEILAGTRKIPTWKVYHAIDYVVRDVIRASSDPLREGQPWTQSVNIELGYSAPYYDDAVPIMTFAARTKEGMLYIHADARMLTNIVSGEIGNLPSGMGAFYLAGVGRTFDYYIVNKENLLITESRSRPGQLLKGRGSEVPWRTTLQQANVVCGKNGLYTTNAKCTTGCREAMGFYAGVDGKQMLGTSMPFYDSGWTLVVEEEADELLMPMWITFAKALGILLLIGAMGAYVFLRLLNKAIIRPLSRLQLAIKGVEEKQDFSKPINIESGDEIGLLGQAFNRMSHSLETVYHDLEQRVFDRTRELHAANLRLQEEIAERKQVEEQVRQLAFHDALTKLPNRRLLNDRLIQTMASSKRSSRYGALMFLDLDNFKPLNDTHGHGVGDLLLVEVANRLTGLVRAMDTVARFGGDEFVVMISELDEGEAASVAQAEIVAEKILGKLSEPYLLTICRDGEAATMVEHHCTASIGVTLFVNHKASPDDILKWADTAMYRAKEAGRNSIRFFDSSTDEAP